MAGILISALTQTGLFGKAKQAELESKEAQKLENVTLGSYENEKEKNLKGTARENENSNIYDISTYSIGTVKVYNSRLTDIQGGYKVIGDTVYAYVPANSIITIICSYSKE